jgi:four helix bundle protein
MIKTYKDLVVWQKAMDLAAEVYLLAKRLPKEETYALANQMRRAVSAVPSNIAEGFGRGTNRDYANFLSIARGSTFETETQLLLCVRVKYLTEADISTAVTLLAEVGKMINSVISMLRSDPKTNH